MESTPFATRETLEQLDWPWVLDQIRARLQTTVAREGCAELLWMPDLQSAELTLKEVDEARHLLVQGQPLPVGTPPDIRPLRTRLQKEAVLQPNELLDIASWVETVDAVRRHLVSQRNQAPLLYRHAAAAPTLGHLVYLIRSAIDETGELRDEASSSLGTFRRKARKIHQEIRGRLEGYLSAPEYQDLLQDRYYTIKEERYVLPIKAGQRTFVEGIVLGSSNSGATLFIEPREIVDLNNTHKLALLDIQKESFRILQEICEHVRLDEAEFEKGSRFLTRIDLLGARARLAESLRATRPELDSNAGLRLLQARHPLLFLTKEEVVPNDIVVSPPTRILLVTGPNAGGKTAVLKTAGIMALMVRAGLPLPVAQGSTIPFFEQIFSDIGDSQSLHENRSTFSGHVSRLALFIRTPVPCSLALLDEILIGTDPLEGSALAQAVLEHLADTGATSLITTHFLSLKALAARDARLRNASLGFHPRTLAPTYELTGGVPGVSNAFFIARECGLPPEILDRALSILGNPSHDIEDLLRQIEDARDQAEAEKARWEELRLSAEGLQAELRQKGEQVQAKERELKKKYRERLENAFQEAMLELRSLRKRKKDLTGSAAVAPAFTPAELGELRDRLLSEDGLFHQAVPESAERVDWSEIASGDLVYLPELRTDARVIRLPDQKGNLTVEAKGFRMQVNATQVFKSEIGRRTIEDKTSKRGIPEESRPAESLKTPPAEHVESCDLRGLNAAEALEALDHDLDRASRSGQPRLVVIHGLGRGVLREAVREQLSRAPYPLHFRPGNPQEGGDGVTIVEFA